MFATLRSRIVARAVAAGNEAEVSFAPKSACDSENEIRGNARPHPACAHEAASARRRPGPLPPGEGEACVVAGNFHAFWCGIASWGLTPAATILEYPLTVCPLQ